MQMTISCPDNPGIPGKLGVKLHPGSGSYQLRALGFSSSFFFESRAFYLWSAVQLFGLR